MNSETTKVLKTNKKTVREHRKPISADLPYSGTDRDKNPLNKHYGSGHAISRSNAF